MGISQDFSTTSLFGFFSVNTDGYFDKINLKLLDLLQYKYDEIIGILKFTDLLFIGEKIYFETHFLPLIHLQGFVKEINFNLRAKDSSRIPVLINASIIKKINTHIYTFEGIVFEISQRKLYEKELLLERKNAEYLTKKLSKINEDLTRFSYVISHDLKAPLSNIISLAQFLRTEVTDHSIGDSLLIKINYIEDSANKLKNMIDGVLNNFKNPEQLFHNKHQIDLTEFFENIYNMLDINQTAVVEYPNNHEIIHINSSALEQIFLNMISNSLKYNDKKLIDIKINFFEDEQFYNFSIQDNGVGIKHDDIDKIFDQFYISHKHDRQGNCGTGIGLSTVKKIILDLGGEIKVESEVQKGTKFSFSLEKYHM